MPFLKKKQAPQVGVMIKQRAPDQPEAESDDKDASIHACASDLINAVHAKDIKGAAEAIRAAFEILDGQPSEEESMEPHSYDAQNIEAGE